MIPTLQPYSLDEKARREERRAERLWWGTLGLVLLVGAVVAIAGLYLIAKFG